MRIAFYAPMKPPDHPIPSGDRRMARLLIEALRLAGHEVSIASRLRSWEGDGDQKTQSRIRSDAGRTAERLIAGWRNAEERPQLWFTYHLYHKAPDWLGPSIARALGIPYVVAEASYAAKQAEGPWADGLASTVEALQRADAVIGMSGVDLEGLAAVTDRKALHRLQPFIDSGPLIAERARRDDHRAKWWHGQPGPWLLAVAMMRPGDKQRSYAVLAKALAGLHDLDWRLAVIGDGPARAQCLAALDTSRLLYLGERDQTELATLYAAADLFVWPAINEAYGLALLEAQAAGLPAIVGRSGGVTDIVVDGATGLVTPPGDDRALSGAIRALLADPEQRQTLGDAACERVANTLDLNGAARTLGRILEGVSP